jgi:hypothetical protein
MSTGDASMQHFPARVAALTLLSLLPGLAPAQEAATDRSANLRRDPSIVKAACVAVTGTIVDATSGAQPDGIRHEADGDTHGWLRVDPQFQELLNAGNRSAEGGNLVFEIICRYPVTQQDARSACGGYTDHVRLPAVGSHVAVTGTCVQDTFHA